MPLFDEAERCQAAPPFLLEEREMSLLVARPVDVSPQVSVAIPLEGEPQGSRVLACREVQANDAVVELQNGALPQMLTKKQHGKKSEDDLPEQECSYASLDHPNDVQESRVAVLRQPANGCDIAQRCQRGHNGRQASGDNRNPVAVAHDPDQLARLVIGGVGRKILGHFSSFQKSFFRTDLLYYINSIL